MKAIKNLLIGVILSVLYQQAAFCTNIEGTSTCDNYLFIMVHGIRADSGIFTGEKEFGNLKKYLEDNLNLKGRIYAYTFKDINGRNKTAAQEFGDRRYFNSSFRMNGECWLEKAKEDYVNEYRKNHNGNNPIIIPTKYIIITHSMGSFAVRAYIYSENVFGQGQGFYKDDISKVVFIAPPLLGSDMVIYAWKLQYDTVMRTKGAYDYLSKNGVGAKFDVKQIVQRFLSGTLSDPVSLYMVAAWIATADIYGEQFIQEWGGFNTLKPTFGGMWDMLPHSELATVLRRAELPDRTKEPAYSIVYGRGIPVYDCYSTWGMAAIKYLQDVGKKKYEQQIFEANVGDSIKKEYPEILSQFIQLDYKWQTLFDQKFWELPTAQAKFMSFLQANAMEGFVTNDGDGMVPTYSAKGEGVKSVANVPKYEYLFKTQPVEDYLNNNFLVELSAAEGIIKMLSGYTGLPECTFWPFRFIVALHAVEVIAKNDTSLRSNLKAHGKILEQYDLIKTAILDTPAVFTINNIQGYITNETPASSETVAFKSFSIANNIQNGYELVQVNSIAENRNARGNIDMPVPMTLDKERMYASSITITKPAKRIVGKLNYLFPSMMKSFEYSFNFAAWKPITNVNSETGEFVLDDLPFAEGQNVLAIRSVNAAGIKNNQILTITLNTIPLLASDFSPLPGTYTNNNKPKVSVRFGKAAYSSAEVEGVKIIEARLIKTGQPTNEERDVSDKISIKQYGGTYDKYAVVEYVPDEALDDGKYQVQITAQSNVGTTNAMWDFTVDTIPPRLRFVR